MDHRRAAPKKGQQACAIGAAMWLACASSVTFAADEPSGHSTPESHAVRDTLEKGADKVGEALKTGAQKVGPPIDHGLATAKKAVEKSADAVGTALKETGKKIEQKVGGKSDSDKPAASTPK